MYASRSKGKKMTITPEYIEQLTFSPSKHGYNTEEVDSFLEQLSTEVDSMLQKIADLKGRLNTAESQAQASQAQVATLQQQIADMEAEAASKPAPAAAPAAPAANMAASEHQISQVLIVAQQSADKLVADAHTNAERIRNEADQKAREVIRQALAEKQSELDEIDRLKQSREDFRAEYKKLLQHFMDDADSVFPEQMGTSTPAPAAPAAAPAPAASAADSEPTAVAAPVTAPTASAPGEDFNDLD